MEQITVFVVDDHALIRRGLADILREAENLEMVGEASDGQEAIETASVLKPDVILMDLHMPRCDGAEATARLKAALPETKTLILTVSEAEEDLVEALKLGARGYILKSEDPELLVQAIHYVFRGGVMISPSMEVKLQGGLESGLAGEGEPEWADLTPREQHDEVDQIPSERVGEDSESAGRPSEKRDDELKGNLELIIPPPAEPMSILKLHRWMEEVGGSTITRVSGGARRETVLSVYVANSISLARLSELPLVAGVAEQRTASAGTGARGEKKLGEAKGNDGPTDEPRRFWVVLNRSAEPDS